MIIVQRLTHPGNVSVRHSPTPGGAIAQNRPTRETLPAGLVDDLGEAGGQFLRRAQDADVAAGEDGAEGRLLRLASSRRTRMSPPSLPASAHRCGP